MYAFVFDVDGTIIPDKSTAEVNGGRKAFLKFIDFMRKEAKIKSHDIAVFCVTARRHRDAILDTALQAIGLLPATLKGDALIESELIQYKTATDKLVQTLYMVERTALDIKKSEGLNTSVAIAKAKVNAMNIIKSNLGIVDSKHIVLFDDSLENIDAAWDAGFSAIQAIGMDEKGLEASHKATREAFEQLARHFVFNVLGTDKTEENEARLSAKLDTLIPLDEEAGQSDDSGTCLTPIMAKVRITPSVENPSCQALTSSLSSTAFAAPPRIITSLEPCAVRNPLKRGRAQIDEDKVRGNANKICRLTEKDSAFSSHSALVLSPTSGFREYSSSPKTRTINAPAVQ